MDITPPEVNEKPHFLSPGDKTASGNQWDRSILTVAWRFYDPESSVVSHTVSIRSHVTGRVVSDGVKLAAETEVTRSDFVTPCNSLNNNSSQFIYFFFGGGSSKAPFIFYVSMFQLIMKYCICLKCCFYIYIIVLVVQMLISKLYNISIINRNRTTMRMNINIVMTIILTEVIY